MPIDEKLALEKAQAYRDACEMTLSRYKAIQEAKSALVLAEAEYSAAKDAEQKIGFELLNVCGAAVCSGCGQMLATYRLSGGICETCDIPF